MTGRARRRLWLSTSECNLRGALPRNRIHAILTPISWSPSTVLQVRLSLLATTKAALNFYRAPALRWARCLRYASTQVSWDLPNPGRRQSKSINPATTDWLSETVNWTVKHWAATMIMAFYALPPPYNSPLHAPSRVSRMMAVVGANWLSLTSEPLLLSDQILLRLPLVFSTLVNQKIKINIIRVTEYLIIFSRLGDVPRTCCSNKNAGAKVASVSTMTWQAACLPFTIVLRFQTL